MSCDIVIVRGVITVAKKTFKVCLFITTECLENSAKESIEVKNI